MRAHSPEEFWANVLKSEGCWTWIGPMQRRYPVWSVGGRRYTAPRYAWELTHGSPPTKWIVHTCENPICVRPDHMRLEQNGEIQRATALRSRSGLPALSGPKAAPIGRPYRKLTAEEVATIRTLAAKGETQTSIARRYGVSQVSISLIVRGLTWRG